MCKKKEYNIRILAMQAHPGPAYYIYKKVELIVGIFRQSLQCKPNYSNRLVTKGWFTV